MSALRAQTWEIHTQHLHHHSLQHARDVECGKRLDVCIDTRTPTAYDSDAHRCYSMMEQPPRSFELEYLPEWLVSSC